MADPLVSLAAGRWSGPLLRRLGLPSPTNLARREGGVRDRDLEGRTVAVGSAPGAFASSAAEQALTALGASVLRAEAAATKAGIGAALIDATGCTDVPSLSHLRAFFGATLRRLTPCARLVVLAADPAECATPLARAVAQGMEGFVRSLAKEVGRTGTTANLLQVGRTAADRLVGPLRFFCGDRSAYVSGRVLRIEALARAPAGAAAAPMLAGKVALVTGAARGLGAATASRLAEDGARVLCIDVPDARPALEETARRVGGSALAIDVTSADAPSTIAAWIADTAGGLDVLVHNAGITRDRTLARMTDAEWDAVMAVNLRAIVDVDGALDAGRVLRDGGREICLSSLSGVAGNFGQTNYATSKAALVGYAAARAAELAPRGITVNCVAPGFIETEMTRRMPWTLREVARRMNALSQGGEPRDVAETVAFLALPDAAGVTGQTLRVCGQALLGA